MKNFKLLLATTAILSTGLAMGVMAGGNYGDPDLELSSHVNTSNTETIHMDVKFVEPLVLSEEDHLDFGTIKSPRAEQKVVMNGNSTGYVDLTGSTATQLFTSGTGAPHLGKLAVSGSTTGYAAYDGEFDFYFTNDSVDLTTGTGDNKRTCGTVTRFRAPYVGMQLPDGIPTGYLYYSATFTVDSGVTANTPLQGSCTGSNTVTLVYGEHNS